MTSIKRAKDFSPEIEDIMNTAFGNYWVSMNAGSVKHIFTDSFDTEEEAIDFCESCGWECVDENGFVWSLEVEEN